MHTTSQACIISPTFCGPADHAKLTSHIRLCHAYMYLLCSIAHHLVFPCSFVSWIEQGYPSGNRKPLMDALEKSIRALEDQKSDIRCLKLWIKYVSALVGTDNALWHKTFVPVWIYRQSCATITVLGARCQVFCSDEELHYTFDSFFSSLFRKLSALRTFRWYKNLSSSDALLSQT